MIINLKKVLYILVITLFPGLFLGQSPWSTLQNFPGTPRASACMFIINDTVYAGTGRDSISANTIMTQDFYKYIPSTNSWSTIASMPSERWMSTAFSIGGKGYVTLGQGKMTVFNELVEYDPATNTWTQKSPFPGVPRWSAFSFVVNNKAYVGGGYLSSDYNDLWEYDPSIDSWTPKASFPNPRHAAVAFAINNKGYMGLGRGGNVFYDDFMEYDPSLNTWTTKANFPDTARYIGTGFSVNNKGYAGLGMLFRPTGGYVQDDFWEYDPILNVWTSIPNIPGVPRYHCVAASNSNTAYILGGATQSLNFLNDFYSFPTITTLIQKSDSKENYSLFSYEKKISVNNKTTEPIVVTLTDVVGKKIFSGTFESGQHTIDLASLANCIIVYQVESKNANLYRGKLALVN
jgi:N-acetylneuraminic acid mutarotase